MFRVFFGAALVVMAKGVVRQERRMAFTIDSGGHAIEEAQTSAPPRFDCDAGFGNWVNGWSQRKKSFCCRHYHKGCSPEAATELAKTAKSSDSTGYLHKSANYVVLQDPRKYHVGRDTASLLGQSPSLAPSGFAFIGLGYDLLKGNMIDPNPGGDKGWKQPVFTLKYSGLHPAAASTIMIPDGTRFQTFQSCNSDVHAKVVDSLYDYKNAIGANFNIQGSTPPVNFQLGAEAQRVHQDTANSTYLYFLSEVVCSVYQLTLDTYGGPDLSVDFVNGVNSLPTTHDTPADIAAYNLFLDSFGTSFVSQATFGGRRGNMSKISTQGFTTLYNAGFDVLGSVAASFQKILGLHGSSNAGLNASFNATDNSHNAMNVHGVSITESSYNIGGAWSNDMEIYRANVANDPAPIFLNTESISSLLTAPWFKAPSADLAVKQSLLETAIQNYCEHVGATNHITNPCTPAVQTPPFAPETAPPNAVSGLCFTNRGAYILWCHAYAIGEGVSDQNPPSWDSPSMDYGSTQCVPDSMFAGIEPGNNITYSCTAVAGRTFTGGEGFPYSHLALGAGQVQCEGTTLSITCVG